MQKIIQANNLIRFYHSIIWSPRIYASVNPIHIGSENGLSPIWHQAII